MSIFTKIVIIFVLGQLNPVFSVGIFQLCQIPIGDLVLFVFCCRVDVYLTHSQLLFSILFILNLI